MRNSGSSLVGSESMDVDKYIKHLRLLASNSNFEWSILSLHVSWILLLYGLGDLCGFFHMSSSIRL